jgi:hypothetical protein
VVAEVVKTLYEEEKGAPLLLVSGSPAVMV